VNFVLGAGFVGLLIFGALSLAFFLTAILDCDRAHVSKPRTAAEQRALVLLKEWLSPSDKFGIEAHAVWRPNHLPEKKSRSRGKDWITPNRHDTGSNAARSVAMADERIESTVRAAGGEGIGKTADTKTQIDGLRPT
jgi:hypothetical protein